MLSRNLVLYASIFKVYTFWKIYKSSIVNVFIGKVNINVQYRE